MIITTAVVVGGVSSIGAIGTGFEATIGEVSAASLTATSGTQSAVGSHSAAGTGDGEASLGDGNGLALTSSSLGASGSGEDTGLNFDALAQWFSRSQFSNTQPQSIGRTTTSPPKADGPTTGADSALNHLGPTLSLIAAGGIHAGARGFDSESGQSAGESGGAEIDIRTPSDRALAELRGQLYIEIQATMDEIIALYDRDGLSPQERDAQLEALEAQLEALGRENTLLKEEQMLRAGLDEDGSLLAAVGMYLLEYAESPDSGTLYERRFEDRERLGQLGRDRKALVDDIKNLKESGASIDEYRELQSQLADIDARIENILERDARRFGRELEVGTDILLPPLEFELKSVGPAAGNEDAVRAYLRSKAAVTAEDLVAMMPNLPLSKAREYEPLLNAAMERFDINTPKRQAAFIAQLAAESIGLTAFEERGSAAYKARYGGYHGRGPIQLTWKGNYEAAEAYFRKHFGVELGIVNNPARAADPEIGFQTAAWFWTTHGMNELADQELFEITSRRINCGNDTCSQNGGVPNGKAERDRMWAIAKDVLY